MHTFKFTASEIGVGKYDYFASSQVLTYYRKQYNSFYKTHIADVQQVLQQL